MEEGKERARSTQNRTRPNNIAIKLLRSYCREREKMANYAGAFPAVLVAAAGMRSAMAIVGSFARR